MRRIQTALLVSASIAVIGIATSVLADVANSEEQTESRTRHLIQQLGSPQYAVRKSAEDELRRMGRAAIDQLLDASYDKNSEIRLTARGLLARLSVRWQADGVAPIVAEITDHYEGLSQRDKSVYAIWLVRLEDGIGLSALARIVRFEPAEAVAKQAAMSIVNELDQDEPVQVGEFLKAYHEQLEPSKRPPAIWLSRFAEDLGGGLEAAGKTVPSWKSLALDESAWEDSPRFNPYIAAMLYQKWAEAAFAAGDQAGGREAVGRLVDLRRDSSTLLVETSFWLIEQEQHTLFRELVWNELPEMHKSVPLLAYCDSIAKRKQGLAKQAQEAADQAFEITESDEKFPDVFERAYTRLQAARKLEQEGYVEPAIREYRRLIDSDSNWQTSGVQYDAASYLAELLHDRQREREAADVLQKVVKSGDGKIMDEFDEDSSNISRMFYFRSEQHRQNGDRAKQMEFLNKAVEANPSDADVLIAMYRLPRADREWKLRTSDLIRDAVKMFEARIKQLREAGEFENRGSMATYLNQVAWLVGNTEGDYKKAIERSRRSLELRPGSGGSLDTLGRTYFAAGDLENALRFQRRAVRMLPHSHQIIRQLEEFQAFAGEAGNKN